MSAHLTGLPAHSGLSIFHRPTGAARCQSWRPGPILPEGEHDDPPAGGGTSGGTGSGDTGTGTGTGEQGGKGSAGGPGADKGFPENTPLAEMTVEQREAYWKHQARKHESRANARGDYDAIKAKAEKYDQIERERQTPSEKAVNDAREQGRREALAEANQNAAKAILRAGLTARGKTGEQAEAIVSGLSLTAFVTDTDVDTDKVATYLESIAGPITGPQQLDLGQGPRGGGTRKTGVAAGREAFEASRKKTAAKA
ncbi:hypothetical protein [Thalassiella azotivora]